jgi:hypothetical protein
MFMLGAAVAWGTAGVAFASTAGRQSVPPPVTGPAPPGGFTSAITTVTIGPAGGVVGPVTVDGAQVAVNVPQGTFPAEVKLTITEPHLPAITPTPGFTVTAGAGIQVTLDDSPYPGTFLRPVTVTFTSPSITASSQVVVWNGSSFVTDPNSTVTAGSASVSFDTDPDFAVETPTTKVTPVTGATSPTTGEPFLGEGILAGALLLGGAGAVVMSRRRRVKAAPAGPAQELAAREGEAWGGAPRMPRAALPWARTRRAGQRGQRRRQARRRSRCTGRESGLAC